MVFNFEKNDKQKILIVFTICFLHFYSNFSYENCFSFEEYFNQNLINLCTKFKVYISDIKKFKIFCYSFYHEIIKQITNFKYEEYKFLYKFYNPVGFNNDKDYFFKECKKTRFIELFQNYFKFLSESGKSFLPNLVDYNFFRPLISTTERVVDMVMSVINYNFYYFLSIKFILATFTIL